MKDGVEVLIDWMTFTVKGVEDPEAVIGNWLGMDPALFEFCPWSVLKGYTEELRFSDIHVCYKGQEKINKSTGEVIFNPATMGVCVSMSGNGCRTFETLSNFKSGAANDGDMKSYAFVKLFHMIAAHDNVNVARLDVACDDRRGFLNEADIRECYDCDGFRTRMTDFDLHNAKRGKHPSGFTLYVGSEKSDFRIKIYDKALQQEESGHWMRCEMVMRHKHSRAFVEQMAKTETESVGELAAQVLNDKFSFIERDDSNISRCTICVWWADFVHMLERVRLVVREVVQHPVEYISQWVRYQIACSLAIIEQTRGYLELADIIEDGKKRLSRKQKAIIRDYNALRHARGAGPVEYVPLSPALPVMV